MNKILMAACSLVVSFAMGIAEAEAAKRLGGGRSVGTQRQAIQPPPPQKAPQQAQQAAPQSGAAAAPAAAAGGSRWLGPIAGLMAGGLLGALFFGGAFDGIKFMDVVMILLLAAGIMFIFRMMRKPQPQSQARRSEPVQYAGVGADPRVEPRAAGSASIPLRPAGNYFPAGFDAETFARQAKNNFVRMQEANDRGDLNALQEMMTPDLYKEIEAQIRERGGVPQKTEVVTLDAEVVEVVTEGAQYVASVRFNGMIKEGPTAQPEHFSEVWHLQKPLNGASGWLMAGIQQA